MAKVSKSKIKAFGLEQIARAMDMFEDEMKSAVDAAIKDTAESIRAKAVSLAPEDTGDLKQGIIVQKFITQKDTLAVYDIGMDPDMTAIFRKPIKIPGGKRRDAYYPTVMEYGTSRIPARPFLRPALNGHRAKAKRAMRDKVGAVINRDYSD